jgi:hypothetical protein
VTASHHADQVVVRVTEVVQLGERRTRLTIIHERCDTAPEVVLHVDLDAATANEVAMQLDLCAREATALDALDPLTARDEDVDPREAN